MQTNYVKRYLFITLGLSCLTLIGIMYIQISWLKMNLDLQQNFLNQKVIKALRNVGDIVSNRIIDSAVQGVEVKIEGLDELEREKLFFKQKFNGDTLEVNKRVLLKTNEIISVKELDGYFKEYLLKESIEDLVYFFGIIQGEKVILTSEKGGWDFNKKLKDTQAYKTYGYPINYKLQGKSLNDMNNIEVLYFGFKNPKTYIYKKLSLSIALMLFFTGIIVSAIYFFLSFILKQEQVEEMKTTFINNMTHEFKTPISTISIAVASMKKEEIMNDKETLGSFIDIIKTENVRMLEMVNVILQNALLSKGELRADLMPTGMHDVLDEIIQKHELLLKEQGGQLVKRYDAKEDVILADKTHLKIAISNIVENAIKYSKKDLELRLYTYVENGYFGVEIRDNGIGIKGENLKNIFKKFYRVENKKNSKHNTKGFGLGLHYTKLIVDIHKGKILVKSKLNVGTTFIVLFPLI